MEKNYFLFLFLTCLFSTISYGQSEYNITFTYDSAGNQSQRNRVCINCGAKAQEVKDSTLVKDLEISLEEPLDELESESKNRIIAYPNPVTDLLNVDWVNDTKSVSQINVFSINNSNIFYKKVNPYQNSLELNFSGYPPGVYIATVTFSDGSRQSFQILKN